MRELAEKIAEAVFRTIEREQRIVKDDLIEAALRVLRTDPVVAGREILCAHERAREALRVQIRERLGVGVPAVAGRVEPAAEPTLGTTARGHVEPAAVADWVWDPDAGVWLRAAEVSFVGPPRDWRWFER